MPVIEANAGKCTPDKAPFGLAAALNALVKQYDYVMDDSFGK